MCGVGLEMFLADIFSGAEYGNAGYGASGSGNLEFMAFDSLLQKEGRRIAEGRTTDEPSAGGSAAGDPVAFPCKNLRNESH